MEERQRPVEHSSSESFLLEEQPCWLDDLLSEPPSNILLQKGHHRSSGDSPAHLNTEAEVFNTQEVHKFRNNAGYSRGFENFDHTQRNKETDGGQFTASEKQHRGASSSDNLGGSSETSEAKPSAIKTDLKRAKQQFAHQSRVKKLQYIAKLERCIQVLQVEGYQVSGELEFLDQQNLLLGMHNASLKQQLDSLAQEQHIKYLERELLDREIGRLQTRYQQQQQQHHHTNQGAKTHSMRHKEASSSG